MKKHFTLPVFLFLLTATTIFSQNVLRVQDPNWWDSQGYQGTITEAEFLIQPQGAYMEVGMFLTFSDEGLGFGSWDTLEVILDFNLPEGAIVYDSWLWMMDDTTIVRADILDLWSATTIYENIVDRRRDPSLLYRKDNGSYQIRVFPLPSGTTRKVKISYLAPAVWSEEDVQSWLPTEILETSATLVDAFKIYTLPNANWQNPRIKEIPDIPFQNVVDPNYGHVMMAEIPNSYINKPVSFTVDAPFNSDGVFVQKLEDGNDKFYQAAYLPPALNAESNPKNLLVLVDHEDANSHIEKEDLLAHLKNVCQTNLTASDQFNFIFSRSNEPFVLSDQWISGQEDSIEQAFLQMQNPIEDQANLMETLLEGISFIKNNGGEGEIILIANSDGLGWNTDLLLDEVQTAMDGHEIKIHIINYQSENFYYEWVWQGLDYWTYQNRDFYHEVTVATGGSIYGSLGSTNNVWANLKKMFNHVKSEDYSFDLYTSLGSGFTFNRFHQNYLGQSQNVNQPILQIGKYEGAFPFQLEYSALVNGNLEFETIEVPEAEIMTADSLQREIWYGHHLRNLENTVVGVSGIQEIIDQSIEERVLTKYTAFLALDLEQGAEPCLGCWEFDEVIVYSTDDISIENGIKIKAFPNPFIDQVSVAIELTEGFSVDVASLSVFDAFGKNILNEELSDLEKTGKTVWTWHGQNANGQPLPAGIYYVLIKTEKGVKTVKLTLMKN